jgi:NAD(P)-dependent dehydrogenase (short-subunit alcohol dehydrogenase family)
MGNPIVSAGSLEGKVAIVTGGASGIGLAIVDAFLAAGAAIAVGDISCPAEPSEKADGRHRSYHLDLASTASIEAMVSAVDRDFGRIDILVNSAGLGVEASFLETTPETYDRLLSVNLRGTFFISQAVARRMTKTGAGRIIHIASVSGMTGNALRAAYAASKSGVIGLARVMAVELASSGILVNTISPGPIETPLVKRAHSPATRVAWGERVPLLRYGTPEEVASVALFLAGDASAYVSGQVIVVDGGFLAAGIMPSRAD